MEDRIIELFDTVACPVLITDSGNTVIYKNKIAKKNLAVPRKGSSITPSIAQDGINILDDEHSGTAIHTLSPGTSIYRRALVFSIGEGVRFFKVWLFDLSLQMIKPAMGRTFLYNASNALVPLINKIIETRASGESILGESWNAPLYKLSVMLNNTLKNLYFINTHTLCSADELCQSLHGEVLSKFTALGITCTTHRIAFTREPVYIDYYSYTLLFTRVLLTVINKNSGNMIDINYIKDSGCFRTVISFASKLSDPTSRLGTLAELNTLFRHDRLNIAMIDALVKSEEGSKFFFEVRRGDMKNVSLIFDIPVKTQPGRKLRQEPDVSDIDLAGFIDLVAQIIRGF